LRRREEQEEEQEEEEEECMYTNLLDNFSFHQLLKAVTPVWENSF
jgi:hypothetical protein